MNTPEFFEYPKFSPERDEIIEACPLLRAFIEDAWDPQVWFLSVGEQKEVLKQELSDTEKFALEHLTLDLTEGSFNSKVFSDNLPLEERLFTVEALLLIGFEVANRVDIEIVAPTVIRQMDLIGELNLFSYRETRDTRLESIMLSGGKIAVPLATPILGERPRIFLQFVNSLDLSGFTGQP